MNVLIFEQVDYPTKMSICQIECFPRGFPRPLPNIFLSPLGLPDVSNMDVENLAEPAKPDPLSTGRISAEAEADGGEEGERKTTIIGRSRPKRYAEICTTIKIPRRASWYSQNQFGRRNLTPFQRAELALKLKPVVEKKAEARKLSTLKQNVSDTQKSAERIETRDELAAMAGISHDTLKRAEVIKEKGTPEQVQRAREGGKGNRIGTIYNEIVTRGIEAQVCSSCGKELPIKEFYANKKQCKACCDRDTKARRQKAKEPPKEAMKAMAEQICDKIRNPTGEVVFTIDDLVEELRINIDPFIPRLRCILNTHPKLITVENQAKIKAVLSEAETAIQKFERSIIYE